MTLITKYRLVSILPQLHSKFTFVPSPIMILVRLFPYTYKAAPFLHNQKVNIYSSFIKVNNNLSFRLQEQYSVHIRSYSKKQMQLRFLCFVE